MIARSTALAALATVAMLPLAAQTANATDSAATPMFTVLPAHGGAIHANRTASLATWSGQIKYNGGTYNFTMVGTDPSKTNTTTTVTAYIIPI